MLFDNDTGQVVPQTPEAPAKTNFDIRMMATRDAQGNLRVTTSTPPELSGAPKEIYRGPGSGHDLKPNNDWEPIGPGDAYNLRNLRVSTGILGFKGG